MNAIYLYRISRWFYLHHLKMVAKLFQALIFLMYNSKVPPNADIGKGTYFVCKGIGVVIAEGLVIGKNCRIGPNFFSGRVMPYKELPKIGDNVWLGANSAIVGPVIIESNVIIAPNSFVNKSIRSGDIVGSTKPKVIGKVNNLDYNIFENPKYKEGIAPYLNDGK